MSLNEYENVVEELRDVRQANLMAFNEVKRMLVEMKLDIAIDNSSKADKYLKIDNIVNYINRHIA